ncbi:hypothetical protein [Synechococcus sp. RedBA-s]|uniref:hypothetical protein n=1 Tax=Synechococcus sp. RedBA-s TaxID=2823741 RepID=UPI0020CD996D|nr:hypothetical protein [Synechococcus sp. RedBA-s]MCP9800273.1 hypothetical protein [Synechococcus sp. RedBA-s]
MRSSTGRSQALSSATSIPGSLVELMALNEQVEREVFALAPSNRRVADATLGMLLADWPAAPAAAPQPAQSFRPACR